MRLKLEVLLFVRFSFKYLKASRIRTVRAGGLDCPNDNQALELNTDFRFETDLSIVFYLSSLLAIVLSCFLIYFDFTKSKAITITVMYRPNDIS